MLAFVNPTTVKCGVFIVNRKLSWTYVVFLLGFVSTFACQAADVSSDARVEKIVAFLEANRRLNKFNGAVLVAEDNKVLLEAGFGIKNASTNTTLKPDDRFRIYSITKSITSTLVLKLVERGVMRLDDKLSRFYPTIARSDEITIEHLLGHTSGLYDFTREPNFLNTEENLIALLTERPLDFSPGQSWAYCNSGYCLLGYIVTKVTGKPFEDAVHTEIFDPLRMTHSGFLFEEVDPNDKAVGYNLFSNSIKRAGGMGITLDLSRPVQLSLR